MVRFAPPFGQSGHEQFDCPAFHILDGLADPRRKRTPCKDWLERSVVTRPPTTKGVTMFFTSHVLDVAERLCDEMAIIDRGRLVAQGTLEQIRAQREVGQDATLEDVFLKLVAADVRREDLSWIG